MLLNEPLKIPICLEGCWSLQETCTKNPFVGIHNLRILIWIPTAPHSPQAFLADFILNSSQSHGSCEIRHVALKETAVRREKTVHEQCCPALHNKSVSCMNKWDFSSQCFSQGCAHCLCNKWHWLKSILWCCILTFLLLSFLGLSLYGLVLWHQCGIQ